MINNNLNVEQLGMDFNASNRAYRFLCVDNCLEENYYRNLLKIFPSGIKNNSKYLQGYLGHFKNETNPNQLGDAVNLVSYFLRPDFLNFLESVTGIKGLITDPAFLGGGFHETFNGGRLGMHTDFRIHESLKIVRRLNVIVYLNEDWEESWNGALLLENDRKEVIRRIYPQGNRMVILETNGESWHGHPEVLNTPEGVSRKSLALYYYTASEDQQVNIPKLNTIYREFKSPLHEKIAIKVNNVSQKIAFEILPPFISRGIIKYIRKIKN